MNYGDEENNEIEEDSPDYEQIKSLSMAVTTACNAFLIGRGIPIKNWAQARDDKIEKQKRDRERKESEGEVREGKKNLTIPKNLAI